MKNIEEDLKIGIHKILDMSAEKDEDAMVDFLGEYLDQMEGKYGINPLALMFELDEYLMEEMEKENDGKD